MKIQKMHISAIPPFKEQVEIKFDEQVNLFIGPNSTGKSTILRTLTPEYRTPWVYIPAIRHTLPRTTDSINMRLLDNWEASAKLPDTGTSDEIPRFFDGNLVYRKLKEISNSYRNGKISSDQFIHWTTSKSTAYSCAKNISADVLHPFEEPGDYIYRQPVRESLILTNVYEDLAIRIIDGSEEVFLGDLSDGTQMTLLWIWHLALVMREFYWEDKALDEKGYARDIDGTWNEQPAVLLIDEIENHLHPTWQRRVIPALLEHFPGLQIFATTHSPFVVAGLKAGQVHLLNRDENGRVTATTNTEDVIGWTADEILRTMMGVDDPTDAATAAAARELRQLRQEPPRDDPEDEERRQQRIADLRQKVDRDLLAGGPMKARREEFERQFAEALEKRLQSRNLNQENG